MKRIIIIIIIIIMVVVVIIIVAIIVAIFVTIIIAVDAAVAVVIVTILFADNYYRELGGSLSGTSGHFQALACHLWALGVTFGHEITFGHLFDHFWEHKSHLWTRSHFSSLFLGKSHFWTLGSLFLVTFGNFLFL